MLFLSSELSKITRDYARLENASNLSKSIQYYKMIYGTLPESGNEFDIATMLYEEQILNSVMKDPISLSATVRIDDTIDNLSSIYSGFIKSLDTDTLKSSYDKIKTDMLNYFNLTYNQPSTSDTLENFNSDISSTQLNDTLNFIAKKSNYPIDCVVVYKSDIITNSYEISVCLESDFFMNKKKWDGGNDDHRYEIGNDLRLNTEIIVQENGKITSSENSSIFK